MRNGQWVKFREPTIDVNGRSALLGEHAPSVRKLPDGFVVGIFQARRVDRLGGVIPAHVCPVDNDKGDNLVAFNWATGGYETIQFIESEAKRFAGVASLPALCVAWPSVEELIASFGLVPVLDLEELPPGRKVAEGFVLRA